MTAWRRKVTAALFVVGLFLIWEAVCRGFKISDLLLPAPSQVLLTLCSKWWAIWPHALATFMRTLLGFAGGVALGILLGVVIGASSLIYDGFYPVLIGFSSIPKVALVPIIVLWCGAGTWPAVLTAMLMSLFPVVVNVATGLATIEPELKDIMHILRAKPLDILLHVSLPRTMPYLFASLKVAITLAFVGTVVSEMAASNKGIGNMMMIASSNFDVSLTFAGLFVLAAMAIGFYGVFAALEGHLTGWAHRTGQR